MTLSRGVLLLIPAYGHFWTVPRHGTPSGPRVPADERWWSSAWSAGSGRRLWPCFGA